METVSRAVPILVGNSIGTERTRERVNEVSTQESWQSWVMWAYMSVRVAESVLFFCLKEFQSVFSHLQSNNYNTD